MPVWQMIVRMRKRSAHNAVCNFPVSFAYLIMPSFPQCIAQKPPLSCPKSFYKNLMKK